MEKEKEKEKEKDLPSYLDTVKKLVGETRYGMVSIYIQDGKVIQIERSEKYRLC